MDKNIYRETDTGLIVISEDATWHVSMPAYVYDLWAPIIKPQGAMILGMLRRLLTEHRVTPMTMKEAAATMGMSNKTFQIYLTLLKNCGFVKVSTPNEQQRRAGKRTVIKLLSPPQAVPNRLLDLIYGEHLERYRPLAHYMTERLHPEIIEEPEWDSVEEDFTLPDEEQSNESSTGVNLHQSDWCKTTPVTSEEVVSNDTFKDQEEGNKDNLNFPERKIAGDDPSAPAITEVDDPPGKDKSAYTEKPQMAAPAPRQGRSREELQAEIKARQRRVAGTGTGKGEVNSDPTVKRKVKRDDLPKVGQMVIDTVLGAGQNCPRELSQAQVAALTKTPITTKGGQSIGRTVADLEREFPEEFRLWMALAPAYLVDRQKKRVTLGNMIEIMRGFDWYDIGFQAFLTGRGVYPEGISHDAEPEPPAHLQQQNEVSHDELMRKMRGEV